MQKILTNSDREALFEFKHEILKRGYSVTNEYVDEIIFEHKDFIIESININGLSAKETLDLIKEAYNV